MDLDDEVADQAMPLPPRNFWVKTVPEGDKTGLRSTPFYTLHFVQRSAKLKTLYIYGSRQADRSPVRNFV